MSSAVEQLSNDVLFGMMSESPDLALNLGIVEVAGRALPECGWPDFSEEGEGRRNALVGDWSARLERIPASSDEGHDALTRAALEFVLTRGFQNRFNGQDGFAYGDHLDPVTHLGGVHAVAVEMLCRNHPLRNLQDAHNYLERLCRLPAALEQACSSLRARRRRGFVAPRVVLERALADIRSSLLQPHCHCFYRALADGLISLDARLRAPLLERAADLIARQILPAYGQLVEELQQHLLADRAAVSAANRPGGDGFYAWRFAGHTTASLTAETAHAVGRLELERIHEELRQLFAELGYRGSLSEAFAQFSRDDAFAEGEEGRSQAHALACRWLPVVRDALRPRFNLWPRADVTVRPIAPKHEDSQYSHYIPPGSPDGEPAVFWINLARTAALPRSEAAVLCFHEAWPGHHVQLALAQESNLPPLRRALLFDAYLEGWAKYAESLPEAVDLVSGPHARIACRRAELYSTATLVLDTGVHAFGWDFETARDCFVAQTGSHPALAERVTLRCAANPGHLPAYKLGLLKIRALRQDFEQARSGAFRLGDYHDAVLGCGALPLDVLENAVKARHRDDPGYDQCRTVT